mgnify:CR=1 FL=1
MLFRDIGVRIIEFSRFTDLNKTFMVLQSKCNFSCIIKTAKNRRIIAIFMQKNRKTPIAVQPQGIRIAIGVLHGAGDESRTRRNQLGKLTPYR